MANFSLDSGNILRLGSVLKLWDLLHPLQALAAPKIDAPAKAPDPVGQTGDRLTDILDIKPPEAFGIHPAWRQYLLYGLLILLAVALVAAAVYFWKRYRRKKNAPVLAEPAHGKALRLLDELGRKTGVDPRMFYFQLSAILRGYMEARFGIDALEMTSEELLPRIG